MQTDSVGEIGNTSTCSRPRAAGLAERRGRSLAAERSRRCGPPRPATHSRSPALRAATCFRPARTQAQAEAGLARFLPTGRLPHSASQTPVCPQRDESNCGRLTWRRQAPGCSVGQGSRPVSESWGELPGLSAVRVPSQSASRMQPGRSGCRGHRNP